MINKIMAGLMSIVFFIMLTVTTIQVVPWYKYNKQPTISTDKFYSPGDMMEVEFDRVSMVDTQARVVRELIRLDTDGNEYEISRVTHSLDIDQGVRVIRTYWRLPHVEECPTMKPNTYLWRGSVSYHPFGMLEKTVKFTTNTFQIRY